MTAYTTQMDAARKGIVTEQMKIVAAKEQMEVKELTALMAIAIVAHRFPGLFLYSVS